MRNPFDDYGMDYLASLDNAFAAAETKTGSKYRDVPDGEYQAYVSRVSVEPTRNDPSVLMFHQEYTILDGQYKDIVLSKNILILPERMTSLKSDLYVYGIELDSICDLGQEDTLYAILDCIVDVKVVHKPSKTNDRVYTNIYLNRKVGKMQQEMDASDTPFGN